MLCLLGVSTLKAQVTVEARVDSVSILIGEQTDMTVSVKAPKGSSIVLPSFKQGQQLVPGVEVLSEKDIEGKHEGELTTIARKYVLTSFDEHLYAIPAQKIKVNGKEYKTNVMALKVVTMEVDTLHMNQFYPPKDVQDNPFQWSEWSNVFWLSFLLVVMLIAAYYLFLRLKQNKPIITTFHIVKHIPPHQKALTAIEKIKAEQLTNNEDQKRYYTELTDTIRQYIRERFGFNAMEMTSSEIIGQLEQCGDSRMIDELRELFQTADLVKFAKYSTLMNENDMNLVNAVNFIDQTKTDAKETEERVAPKLSESETKSVKNRMTIKVLLCGIAIVGMVLLCYVVYSIYMLIN